MHGFKEIMVSIGSIEFRGFAVARFGGFGVHVWPLVREHVKGVQN